MGNSKTLTTKNTIMKVQFEILNDKDLKKMLALNELLFDGDSETVDIVKRLMESEEPIEITLEGLDEEAASKFQSMMIILALKQLEKEAKAAKAVSDEQSVS